MILIKVFSMFIIMVEIESLALKDHIDCVYETMITSEPRPIYLSELKGKSPFIS